MNKYRLCSLVISLLAFAIPTKQALAVCPVCTVAVGAGLGISRYLGIDDTVSGVWVGGLVLSSSFWFTDWLKKKKLSIKRNLLAVTIIILMSALTFIPLWKTGIIGHPLNTLLGVDKLVLGSIAGVLVFLYGMWADKVMRKIKGHQLFIYQKVVFPVSALAITSLIFYLITKKP